jgi:hypothetical protein
MEKRVCPECGTELHGVLSCNEYLEKMIAWDFSDFAAIGQVHHLTVLCYYIQHPSHYSKEGLQIAISILKKTVEENLSDKELYTEESEIFSSSKRDWKVSGNLDNYGSFEPPIQWSMTVSSVVCDGIAKYKEHVKEWSQLIYADLEKAGLFS